MKRFILACLFVVLVSTSANAVMVAPDYSWEDGGTILGSYNSITATVDTTYAYSGSYSLKLVDGGGSTPQAYVGWVTGLSEGDEVTAGFWVYDETGVDEYPKGRIWGHYTDDSSDIDSYAGSASGNSDYSGSGWTYLEYSWIFDSDGGTRDGLVIEARTYTDLGDTIWIDDLYITAPDTATILTPATVPVPASLWLMITGILGFVGYKRRKP